MLLCTRGMLTLENGWCNLSSALTLRIYYAGWRTLVDNIVCAGRCIFYSTRVTHVRELAT